MDMLSPELSALMLTLKLSLIATVILLLCSLPFSWWLARTESRIKPAIEALIAMPLVLPPTVLGFYLLLAMSPDGPLASLFTGASSLAFSFEGIVIGSLIYSLPFVVQPMQAAFSRVDNQSMEAAATLGASPLDRFFSVAVPMALPGVISAAVMGFAHTTGEFGVVLMIGGSIPDETRVLSIAIYESVELLDYRSAHLMSGGLVFCSFVLLLLVYARGHKYRVASL